MNNLASALSAAIEGGKAFDVCTLDLSRHGYIEQEHFLSGTATTYKAAPEPGAPWKVRSGHSARYCTRMLVRRPADPGCFNGTVVVEWLNVAGLVDASVDWIYTHTEILRDGFAWVGVSVQHAGVTGSPHAGEAMPGRGLVGFDPKRYAALAHPGDDYSYGIFSQAGWALRRLQPGEGLGALAGAKLVATGSSQSARRLTTYVNVVDPIVGAYDAYMLHGRSGGAAPIELPAEVHYVDAGAEAPVRLRPDLRVPVLALQSETDVVVLGYFGARQDDTERLRLWEVAGAAHADKYMTVGCSDDGGLRPDQLAEAMTSDPSAGVNRGLQHHYVANAAISSLHRWVHDGVASARAPRLSIAVGAPVPMLDLDEHGNAKGGVRTPRMDVPLAVLSGVAPTSDPISRLFGSSRWFDADTVKAHYGSQADYLAAFEVSLDRAIENGFLLQADREEVVAVAAATFACLAG